jgi:hypothetical protein
MRVTTRTSSVLAANPMTRTTKTSSVVLAANPMTRTTKASSVPAYDRSVAPLDTDIAKEKPSSSAKRNASNDNKEPYQRRSRRAKRTSSDSAPPGLPPNQKVPPLLPVIGHIRIGPAYQASIPAKDYVYSHSESSEDHGDVLWDPSLVPIIQTRPCSLIGHLAVDARTQTQCVVYQLQGLLYILREMAIYKEDYDIQTEPLTPSASYSVMMRTSRPS